ncbi:hypothetical protein HHL28_10260 [Aerophototrophica crusticola]|uniref:Uncharacterized protein n=1 Tax=Aerophototrophica crusticola TaxID=1709002 RepID=A0A858R870_9PROT|nr:hypothetical protein HHL28_10260 [Rhodospirillaceae bacterium B3]
MRRSTRVLRWVAVVVAMVLGVGGWVAPAVAASVAVQAGEAHGCCDPVAVPCPAACAVLCHGVPLASAPVGPLGLAQAGWEAGVVALLVGRLVEVEEPPPRDVPAFPT